MRKYLKKTCRFTFCLSGRLHRCSVEVLPSHIMLNELSKGANTRVIIKFVVVMAWCRIVVKAIVLINLGGPARSFLSGGRHRRSQRGA